MVYVHELIPCKRNKNYPYDESCHLIADTVKELREFGEKINLRPEWIQMDSVPHFDLTKKMRAIAMNNGAVNLSLREFAQKTLKYKQDKMKLKKLMANEALKGGEE